METFDISELLQNAWVVRGAAFGCVGCIAYLLVRFLWGDQRRISRRMNAASSAQMMKPRYGPSYNGVLALLKPLKEPLAKYLIPNDAEHRTQLQAQFYKAGVFGGYAIALFSIAKFCLVIALPLLTWTILASRVPAMMAIPISAATGIIGLLAPTVWLQNRIAIRQRILRKSLPDFLDLLLACTEGGMGIQAAIAEVARELAIAHPELAAEFEITQREMEIGRNLEVALQNLAERTGIEELRSLMTFVQQSQKFGATISEALRQLSDMLRVQREHRAEELAHQAAVKVLMPTLLLIFPTVFVILAGPAAIQIYRSFNR
jgi:tight adherence protein C